MRTIPLLCMFLAGAWWGSGGGAPARLEASGPADFREAVARAQRSVVLVGVSLADAPGGGRSRDDGVGSGFVLSADGLIATSRHVVQGARVIAVEVPERGVVSAQVVGHDESVDLTVLRVPLTGLVPLDVGDSRSLMLGQWVLTVGSPFRLNNSWSAGIVSGLHRRQVAVDPRTHEDFIQSDAAANLGNSGGPLLDASGRAVGMVTQILTRSGGFQGISLATPIEAVMAAARRLSGGGAVRPPPTLGVVLRRHPQGLEVVRFSPGSPAQAAGLRIGDLIVAAGGQALADPEQVPHILAALPPGQPLTLRVSRGAMVVVLEVALP